MAFSNPNPYSPYVGPYSPEVYERGYTLSPASSQQLSSLPSFSQTGDGSVSGVNETRSIWNTDTNQTYDTPQTSTPAPQITEDFDDGADEAAEREAERQEQLQREIDDLYGGLQSNLDNQRNSLLGTRQDFMDSYSLPFDAQVPLVQQAGQQGQEAIGSARLQTQEGSRNALDDASRLFNELTLRNRQQFGGAGLSSTSLAAGDILGREQMRNVGNIRQNTTNALADLETQSRNLEQQVTAEVNSLELRKQQALSQARQQFDSLLREIDSRKGELEANKSVEKINALREFNQYIRQIEDQSRQVQFDIAQRAQAAQQQMQSSYSSLLSGAGQAGAAAGDIAAGVGGINQQTAGDLSASQGAGFGDIPLGISGRVSTGREDQGLQGFGIPPVTSGRFDPNQIQGGSGGIGALLQGGRGF